MKRLYDVVVVGAGPGGTIAAKTAAEHGLEVALLERKMNLSIVRRACTACLGIKDEFFGDVQFFDDKTKRLLFPRNGFSIKYDGPTLNIYGFHLTSPNGTKVKLGDVNQGKKIGNDARVAVMVHKGQLIQGLADECRANGVHIYLDTNVIDIWNEPDGVVVSDHRGNQYKGRFVIAADGVNSRIMRKLGINKERKWLGTYKDRAQEMEGVEFDEMDALIFAMGWNTSISLAPSIHEGWYHVAAASYNWRDDLEKGLQEFMESPAYAPWFKKARVVAGHGSACVSNIYSSISVPYKDNVLIVGDAGWMQECSIGGALMMGNKAAYAVIYAIDNKEINKQGVSRYLEWWDKYLYGPYGRGGGFGADLKDYITAEDINYLASLIDHPLRATLDFFTIYRSIGRAYLEQFPRISDERPDIMEKFMAMRSVHPEDGLAKRRRNGFLSLS
jgi:digeranylgeranylglycerophospholipid reductase